MPNSYLLAGEPCGRRQMGKMTKRDKMLERKERITNIKLRYYYNKIKVVEDKIKALHVIDYGDYFWQYRNAQLDYFWCHFDKITPYGRECLEQKIRDEYYEFIEYLYETGYRVRW